MSRIFSLFLLFGLVSVHALFAQGVTDQIPARITIAKVTGEAFVLNADRSIRLPIEAGVMVQQGQVLVTEKGSSVLLVMPTGATVMMAESTMLKVDEFRQAPFKQAVKLGGLKSEPSSSTTRLDLMRGEIMSDVKKLNKGEGSSFEIKTPVGAAGIRGTAFRLSFIPHDGRADFALVMAEGSIEFIFNAGGQGYVVDKGRQLVIRDIRFDPSSGRLIGLPAEIHVEQASVEALGRLMEALETMLNTVESVEVQGHDGGAAEITSETLHPAVATPASELPSFPLSNITTGARDPQAVRTSPTTGEE